MICQSLGEAVTLIGLKSNFTTKHLILGRSSDWLCRITKRVRATMSIDEKAKTLHAADWAIIAGYFVLCIAVGLWVSVADSVKIQIVNES